MGFDLATAVPVKGFDLASAKPVDALHDQIAAQVDNDAISRGARNFAQDANPVMNYIAGRGKAGSDLVHGIGQRLGLVDQATIDETKRLDAPLMATKAGMLGNIEGNITNSLPLAIAGPSIPAAIGVGAGLGFVQPTATGDSVLKNTAIGGALGGAAAGTGRLLSMGANKLMASAAANQVSNAGRDAAVKNALASGYVLPPTEINPNMMNTALEGLSGKIKTNQTAAFKNQPVTNKLAAKALGLPEDTVLTSEVLQAGRKEAGAAYEAVKATGTVKADDAYNKALDNITSKYQGAAQSFPGLAKNEIPEMVDALRQPSFDAGHAVDAIGLLRENADKAFRAGDTGLAKAAKDAARAMEDQLGRHLEATGQDPALVDAFKSARQSIAKNYSVNKALNPATGDVSAASLGKELSRGKPLSDELLTIAEANKAFPKATQSLTSNPNQLSPLDWATGVAAGIASGNPLKAAAAALAARPAVRGAILSGPYQRFAASGDKYAPNGLVKLLSSDSTPGALVGQARRSSSAAIERDKEQAFADGGPVRAYKDAKKEQRYQEWKRGRA